MLITDTNIDIWYKEYLTQYRRTEKYVKSRGGKVRDIRPSSRADFKIDLISTSGENPKLSGKQIAQRLAKEELYETSWKQAERYAKAHAEKFGEKYSLNLVQRYRMHAVSGQSIWTVIKERRTELNYSGLSSYASNLVIAQEFFGSE